MTATTRFPRWRNDHEASRYPFEDNCTLRADTGFALPSDLFLDAAFYLLGGGANCRLARVVIDGEGVTLHVTDDAAVEASGRFLWNSDNEVIRFADAFDRAAGMLVTDGLRMASLQAWGEGTHTFADEAAVFTNTINDPLPALGVSGLEMDDGQILTDDAVLVAEDGLMFSCDTALVADGCGRTTESITVAKINAVGNPLFLRERCEPGFFQTPRFLRTLVFQRGEDEIEIGPGDLGSVLIAQAPFLVDDTILRVTPVQEGVRFSMIGERLAGNG